MKGIDLLVEQIYFSVVGIGACICAQICVIHPKIQQPISDDAWNRNIAGHYAELTVLLFWIVFAFEEAHGQCLLQGQGAEAGPEEDRILISRPNIPPRHFLETTEGLEDYSWRHSDGLKKRGSVSPP